MELPALVGNESKLKCNLCGRETGSETVYGSRHVGLREVLGSRWNGESFVIMCGACARRQSKKRRRFWLLMALAFVAIASALLSLMAVVR